MLKNTSPQEVVSSTILLVKGQCHEIKERNIPPQVIGSSTNSPFQETMSFEI
jgi:hypothetical protein